MVGLSRRRGPTGLRAILFITAALALASATVLAPRAADAQSARASFFLQMLRQNPDARVRVSAALRLGELHEAETVPLLIQIFSGERDATVQAAILSSFATIGDARALPTVQAATRSAVSAVAAQARRALPVLTAAAGSQGGATTPSGAGSAAGGASNGAAARFLIGVGTVNNNSSVRGPGLVSVAQQAIQTALGRRGEVVVHQGPASAAQGVMRSRRLNGHYFDANIQSVEPRGQGVRASVSIAVSSYPGRVYEFESQTAITISGGSSGSPEAQADAVRRAIESAANRAVDQLLQGGGR